MKQLWIIVLTLAAIAPSLRAANPIPYTEGVSFSFKIAQGEARLTIYDETGGNPNQYTYSPGGTVESGMGLAWMRPGVKYHLNFSGNYLTDYYLSFIAPTGYRLIVDNKERNLLHDVGNNAAPVDPYTPAYVFDCSIELQPLGAATSEMPLGSFSGIQVGQSIAWSIGLGGTQLDRSAGRIGFREYNLSSSPASRDKLFLSTTQYNVGDTWSINDGGSNQTLRQVMSPEGVVDILDDGSGGYRFRFFLHSQSEGSPGNPNILYGSPWKTIHVQSPGSNQLKITETEGSATRVSHLTLTSGSVSSGNYVWTLQEGDGTTWLRTTTHTSSTVSGGREEIVRVYTGGSTGTPVAETKYRYENVGGWGEEVVQMVQDPTGAALTTSYTYHTNSSNRGDYRKVRSVTTPTGGWTAYDYYDDWDTRGQLQYEFSPYLDTPSTVPTTLPTTHTGYSGQAVYHTYLADWTGRKNRPDLRQVWLNGTRVAQTTWGVGDTYPTGDFPHEYAWTMTYNDDTHYTQEYFEYWRADAYPSIKDRPFVRGNANLSQTSWSYGAGDYNSTTGAFTSGTSIQYGRMIAVHGTTSSSGATALTSWDGHTFASVYVIANKSTMDVTIYQGGRVLRTEQRVYTGSGFAVTGWTQYTYNSQGRLTEKKHSNGAIETYTYTNGLLTSQTGIDGVQIDYTYDQLWRVATVKKVGVSASGIHAAQADVTTTYTYDGANRVTAETVSASGQTSIVTAKAYDKAGRLTSITPPSLSATTHSYNASARTHTVTAPDGGTTITETHRDGRIKSVTGTAVVPQYYSYNLETDGRQRTQLYTGYSGSPRWKKTWTDWRGRLIKTETPGFSQSSQPSFIEEQIYHQTTGQLIKKTRTGYDPTLYVYNTLGQMIRSGVDVGNGGTLVTTSMDRITDTDVSFENSSGNWWLKQTTTTYPDDNADTHPITSISRTRLTGFASGQRAEVRTTDAEGNTTVSSTTISGKLVTTQTTVSGLTANDGYAYIYNGMDSAATGHDGLTTKLAYDALGRLSTRTDSRGNVTTTTYNAGTIQIYQVKDDTNAAVTTNYYDGSTGRLVRQIDALGYSTRYAYNNRGQVTHQWGDAGYPIAYTYDATYGDRTEMKTYRSAPASDSSSWPSVGTADTTKFHYDTPTGIMWKKEDADGKSVVMDFNSRGLLSRRTLARGVYTDYSYNTTGELTLSNHSDATPDVSYTYTRLGQVETVTDGTGVWDYIYDSAKPWRLSAVGLPSFYGSRTQTMLYESSGMVGRYKGFQLGSSAGGYQDMEQVYTYSTDGRFDTLISKRASNTVTRTFDYSYLGNAPFVSGYTITGNSYFSVTRDYESDRNVLKTIDTKWTTTLTRYDYTYDDRYQRQTAKQSGSAFSDYYTGSYTATWNHYTYNPRGELQTAVMYGGNTPSSTPSPSNELPGRRFEYRYDSIGNRTSAGPTGSSGGVDEEYETNKLNQYVKRENNTVRVLGVLGNASANVAVAGAISTSRKDKAWGADIVPDNLSHAVSGTATVYAAIPGGGAGGKDLLRTENKDYFVPKWEQTFGYDVDGNMTHDSVWDYTYDAENRLIGMQHRAEVIGTGMIPSASARKLVFAYDYQGRRVRKTVYGGWNGSTYTGSAISDTKYLYDGWNLIAEFNVLSSMSVVRSYTWGLDLTGSLTASGGVGALLQVYDATASKTLLPAYDGNGNIAAMINADSGALEAIYEYDPYGNLLRKEGAYAASNPFRFSTKYTDVETGLVYYGYRYYSPDLGRFINRDPIEEQGGVNLYSFVRNNAVNAWDYLGMVAHVDSLAILRYSNDPEERAWNQRPSANSDPGLREGGGGAANLMSFRPDVVNEVYNALAKGVASAINKIEQSNSVHLGAAVASSINAMFQANIQNVYGNISNNIATRANNTVGAGFDMLAGRNLTATQGQLSSTPQVSIGQMVVLEAWASVSYTVASFQAPTPAPNSALQQAQATAAQLGWNGFTTNLSESQQLYYGKTAADILALQAQGKDVSQLWKAVVNEVPGVIVDSNGNMAGDSADLARVKFLVGAGAIGGVTVGVTDTLARIARGESFPHRNDGSVFQNREGLLPRQAPGYYREYVVPTQGNPGPGAQRVVIGQAGEVYYTADHYRTFVRVPAGGGGGGKQPGSPGGG